MQLESLRQVGSPKHILIRSSAAHVIIRMLYEDSVPWQISWRIRQEPNCETTGTIILATHELETAFCLREQIYPGAEKLIAGYGGSSAVSGKFFRRKRWLNIPCPGTGVDGDPNISIKVTEEIQGTVRLLIAGR